MRGGRLKMTSVQRHRLMVIRVLGLGGAVGLFMFFAWRTSPWLSELPWLPHWLSAWADEYGVARNVAAFFAFGLVGFTLLGRGWRPAVLQGVFATGLEVVQIWLPRRLFDWRDILASLFGLFLGWLGVTAVACLLRAWRRRRGS